jgi:ribonuclease HI
MDIIYLLQQYSVHIAALNETWIRPHYTYNIPGYSVFRSDRDEGRGGGVALLVKSSLHCDLIQIPSNPFLEIIALSVDGIGYVSIYIPPNGGFDINYFNSIVPLLPPSFFLFGDYNAHSCSWGCSLSDRAGNQLLSFVDKHNLCILNDGSPTRLSSPNQNPSAVDLTICSGNLACSSSWSILDDPFSSDHFPIFVSLSVSLSRKVSFSRQLYSIKKANWTRFAEIVKDSMLKMEDTTNSPVQKHYDDLTQIIYEAANNSIPIGKKFGKHTKNAPWWDQECSDLIAERKQAMHNFRNKFDSDSFVQVKAIQAKVKKKLRAKKRQSWQKYCSSLSPNSSPSHVWNMIRRFKGSLQPSRASAPPSEWLPEFLNNLAPPFAPCWDQLTPPNITNGYLLQNNNRLQEEVNIYELKICLQSVKHSSPGEDRIPYVFFQKAPDIFIKSFLNLLNKILSSGEIPNSWKHQLIIPVLKPGKNPKLPSSYRPIALSACAMKILEHILKSRLVWYIEHNSILPSSQFGFRKSLSCVDNLSVLITDIQIAFTMKKVISVVFLDITSAFDNVSIPILFKKLSNLGVPHKMATLIFHMFTERSISVSGDVSGEYRKVWKGLPQGSVLSPILFNIYCSDLPKITEDCKLIQYADDIAIYSISQNNNSAEKALTGALNTISKWMERNNLFLSPQKSTVVTFSRKHVNPSISVELNGNIIPQCEVVKFLGLTLDRKLTWNAHVTNTLTKCEKGLNILRAISSLSWGSHPSSMKNIYNALIRSHLDYASFLLTPISKNLEIKLDTVQTKSLRLLVGAMSSTPNNSLQVECVDMPLKIRRQYLSDSFFIKKRIFTDHPLLKNLPILCNLFHNNGYWKNKLRPYLCNSYSNFMTQFGVKRYPFPSAIYDLPLEVLQFFPNVFDNIGIGKSPKMSPNRINQVFFSKVDSSWPNHTQIFTDGSKFSAKDHSGSAVLIPNLKIKSMLKLPPEASVFTAECAALRQALVLCDYHKLERAIIFTDSLSLVNFLASGSCTDNCIILDIRRYLFGLKFKGRDIVVAWIPAHCGIAPNEDVDSLAKEATNNGLVSGDFELPLSDIKRTAFLRAMSVWTENWDEVGSAKGSVYRSIKETISRKPWYHEFKFSRSEVVTLTRMRFNHHRLDSHLFKINIVSSPLCECELDMETLDHVFLGCPIRDSYNLYYAIDEFQYPINMSCLLHSQKLSVYRKILKSVKQNYIII